MYYKVILLGYFLSHSSITLTSTSAQFTIAADETTSDATGLAEIVEQLNVPTITVLLLRRRWLKSLCGEFLSLINNNLQQSMTFDDREKFLLWVEQSQKLGFSTTTLVFGRPKDLIEEVKEFLTC